jgi:hypothetical protein
MLPVCARVRARHGVLLVEPGHDVGIQPAIAKPSQGPSPLRSQDSGRRLLPGQSGARQGALPLPWRKIEGPKTEAGRNRIAEAHRQRWRAYRERIPAV